MLPRTTVITDGKSITKAFTSCDVEKVAMDHVGGLLFAAAGGKKMLSSNSFHECTGVVRLPRFSKPTFTN